MPTKPKKMPCPKCERAMRFAMRTSEVPIAGRTFKVRWRVWECKKDGAFVVPPSVHQKFERDALRVIATEGPANGTTLKYMRGRLGLKGTELAARLGVQPETLSRWENGAQPVSGLVWVTVARMTLDMLDGQNTTAGQLRAAITREPVVASTLEIGKGR